MADVVGFPVNRAQTGVSVSSFQQADEQRRQFEQVLKEKAVGNADAKGPQSVDASKGLQAARDVAREAARVQRVDQPPRSEKNDQPTNQDPSGTFALRGQTVDIKV